MNEGYALVQLANGSFSIHSRAERETFHPVAGPVEEAQTLYIEQLQLRERLATTPGEFVIWDVGLGAGGNVLTALRQTAGVKADVRIVSFDRTLAPLEFALNHARELKFISGFEDVLEKLLHDRSVAFANDKQHVQWKVMVEDFPSLLARAASALESSGERLLPVPHAIFFDAFSPARNPEMWTLPLFEHLHALLEAERPCALATFSRSTMVRTALLLAGFFVGTGKPLAGKEETTVAANVPGLATPLLNHAWLERTRRSSAAEPLRQPRHLRAQLSAETWERLRAHPQFHSS